MLNISTNNIEKQLNLFHNNCEIFYNGDTTKTLFALHVTIKKYEYRLPLEEALLTIIYSSKTLKDIQLAIEKKDTNLQKKFYKHLVRANKNLKSLISEEKGELKTSLLQNFSKYIKKSWSWQYISSFNKKEQTQEYQKLSEREKKDQ